MRSVYKAPLWRNTPNPLQEVDILGCLSLKSLYTQGCSNGNKQAELETCVQSQGYVLAESLIFVNRGWDKRFMHGWKIQKLSWVNKFSWMHNNYFNKKKDSILSSFCGYTCSPVNMTCAITSKRPQDLYWPDTAGSQQLSGLVLT